MDVIDRVENLIVEACAMLADPAAPRSDAAFEAMACLRVELLDMAAQCEALELGDDCCDVAAQLERRLAEAEARELAPLAESA